MKNRKPYASRLTKDELIKGGISLVTEDGLIFRGEKQVKPSLNSNGYWMIPIYVLDENGNRIKKPIKRQYEGCSHITDTYTYEARVIGLHRLMWAWHFSEVPEGYVVDHISNKHENLEDYHLSNLQLLTPGENLAKERRTSTRQVKCSLKRPLSWYEDRLNMYLDKYNEAKATHNAELAHKLRTNIADTKARIRYHIANKGEN